MQADFNFDPKTILENLTCWPDQQDKEFIRHGATLGEVHRLAGQMRAALGKSRNQVDTVCLAAENKAFIAASILCALSGGPSLLLPFAVSGRAFHGMHKQGVLSTVITDKKRDIPAGVPVISMDELAGTAPVELTFEGEAKQELLHIYTGGTTGAPQIWPKTRWNLIGEGCFLQRQFGITESDTILATIPPYHIYGLLFSVVLPLVSGAAVIEASPSFPGEIEQAIKDYGVSVMASVPAHYRVLGSRSLGLRLAFSSAGLLAENDNNTFCQGNTSGIVEVYGSTETGGIATRNRSLGEDGFTPFATIDWQLVEECLAVRSPYISPNLPVDKNGFFVTNDRVEQAGQNRFRLLGRADSVVKVAGKRVDMAEIAVLIKEQQGVVDCVVTSFTDPGGRESWVGALVEGSVKVERVREVLSEVLEPYALPRRIKVVDAIPVRASGKYDRDSIEQLLMT